MQATESSSFGFSILSRRRDQVHSMESNIQETELGLFQKQVSDRFHDLAAVDSSDLLSIQWIQKLLATFLCCLEEFKTILFNNKSYLNKPPMDKYLSDFLDRSVKALDVCNAIRDGIEQIRQWQKQFEIVLCALDNQRSIGEGQIRRAKKALIDLTIGMLDEKGTSVAKRNRSFGRNDGSKEQKSFSHFRSLSWSVSRTWSAAKQLQAIGSNLVPPKSSDILSSNGLSVAVFTMNNVLLFMMWALVAAIPCQDRGIQSHFNVTRQFIWAGPIISLHERILDESKRRDRRNACGLLKEIHEIEKCARVMNALTNSISLFPLNEEKEEEVKLRVEEVRLLYKSIKDRLEPLERQVREVFHRIVRCRTEGLDSFGKTNVHS